MADPKAEFVVTATDATAAAFRSADRGMRQMQRTAMGMRSALASVGVVLSARAFAGWIKGALDAKNMTQEQLDATREARAAMQQMKAASDDLARSLGASLAPAMQKVAEIAIGLNAIFFNADPSPYGKQIQDLKDQLAEIDKHAIDTGIGTLLYTPEQVAEQERLSARIRELNALQLEALTGGRRNDKLEEFDIGGIRAKQREAMLSMPTMDLNAPTDEMKRRAAEITENFRSEVEKQVRAWQEAEQLFARGMISADTLRRMDAEQIQFVEVTAKRIKDTNAERLKDVLQTFKSEQQLEQERYTQRLEDLQELYDAELVQREEFFSLKESLEQEHQDRMTEIEQAAAEERFRAQETHQQRTVNTIISGMVDATAALSNSSKRMFELNKKFAKAEAVINAYRAIQQVWADPTLPFYAKIAATAITAVKTAANISAINSASFGSGTTPSAAGTATVNNVPVASDQTITVRGITADQLFTGRQLVELLNEATKNGAKLVLAN